MLSSKLKIFLGNCNIACNGEWITLPMEDTLLDKELNRIYAKYGEVIISSHESVSDITKSLHINQYADVKELNFILKQSDEFIALYVYSDEDLEFAQELSTSRKFLFFPGVNNLEELGEAVAKKGLIGYIPKNLINLGYIDFEAIGNDFNCNGIRLYDGLGAIGEISDDNFIKWKELL